MRLAHGTFGWVDLQTSDVAVAKAFYAGLFGWTYEDMPTPMGVDYTMCFSGGQMVTGMGPQPGDMAAAGVPSMWNSYVFVEDVDAVIGAVEAAGGSVMMPVMDVMTSGRMTMVASPDGAVIGVWQPWDHQGAEVFDAPGSLTWNELQSRDLDAAMPFLTDVFGWRWEQQPGDMEYYVCHVDGKADDSTNGGAMRMPDGVPAEAPSMWVVYFAVTDCDAAASQVLDLGGDLFMQPMEMGPGKFAGATDPTGAMFFFGSFPDLA
jgi:predicted enzyme related to lactoylglutathione lyase